MSHSSRRTLVATGAGVALIASLAAGTAVAAPGDDPAPLRGSTVNKPGETTVQVVKVEARTPKARTEVGQLGLDTTEHADADGIDVVLHGAADAEVLRKAGFDYEVVIADLGARVKRNAAEDRAYAEATPRSPLPSGSNRYRYLKEFNAELDLLAERYPRFVKPLTLANPSVKGRPIRGVEITRDAENVADGKPVFLMMGAHHAREWPSAEHTMEFAYDLLTNWRIDDRARRIVNGSRTILIPVINPDGYRVSRLAESLGDFSQFDYEMKRKNCAVSENTPPEYRGGTCQDNPAGRLRGTDLNRNYPGFWGGPGASPTWSSDVYRGDAPGSAPEVDGVRQLISERQVTNLISNHTYSNLVLRPPAIRATGFSPDEPAYRALGDRMTQANGYANWASFQLYDTSGSTEDWSYWNTGGLGFTWEIGPDEFHPPYKDGVVAEYLGLEPAAGAGSGGNREAYYRMAEATLDRGLHSEIRGTAPPHRELEIRKRFISATSPVLRADETTGPPLYYEDVLTSRYTSEGGRFRWDVNPSTRPVVVGRYGREPQGPPAPPQDIANPDGIPADGETEEFAFTIEGMPDYDNGVAVVSVQWSDDEVDWDLEVLDSEGRPVAEAASLDNPEEAQIIDPTPGDYTAVVTNYAGGADSDWTGSIRFESPTPGTYSGLKEAWMLTCSTRAGRVLSSQEVVVDRGDVARVGDVCSRRR